GEGELMAHDVPLGCAPDEYDDLISGTCSHLPYEEALNGKVADSNLATLHMKYLNPEKTLAVVEIQYR
ncbi:hypothetical protein RF039_24485, partial [Enterobacter sichuanensis]|nr:hypothetical protein [Enterobacter sichuanensis]